MRSQIAYVPQDPLMFHRTLRQNIAFGRLDADDAEIRNAAEAANAAEFVEGLPQGYDTLAGERGVKPRVVSASGSPLPATPSS